MVEVKISVTYFNLMYKFNLANTIRLLGVGWRSSTTMTSDPNSYRSGRCGVSMRGSVLSNVQQTGVSVCGCVIGNT